jgi:hypothetical protein
MQEKVEYQRLGEEEKQELFCKIENNALEEEDKLLVLGLLSTFDEVCASAEQRRGALLKIRNILGFKTEKDSKPKRTSSVSDAESQCKKKEEEEMEISRGLQIAGEILANLRFQKH